MKKIVTLLSALVLSLTLVACGASTLEEYYNSPSAKKQMDEAAADYKNSESAYKDVQWSATGNTLTYTYTFADAIEYDEDLDKTLEAEMTKMVEPMLQDIKDESGVQDTITVKLVFCSNDGKEVYKYSYTK